MTTRLGGFVIHAGFSPTLEAAVRSLQACCDHVVCVDSAISDRSRALQARLAVEHIDHPWRGYGSARRRAAEALSGFDYLFFLDSDEWLEPDDQERLKGWKKQGPFAPFGRVHLSDWAEFDGTRFLFRREHKKRLIRADQARWQEAWIVHESLPRARMVDLPITVQHHFVSDLEALRRGQERYALLWAIRAFGEGRRQRNPRLHYLLAGLKNALLNGAFWRAGRRGWRLAWLVARYHRAKYQYLDQLRQGANADIVAAWRAGDYPAVYAQVEKQLGVEAK